MRYQWWENPTTYNNHVRGNEYVWRRKATSVNPSKKKIPSGETDIPRDRANPGAMIWASMGMVLAQNTPAVHRPRDRSPVSIPWILLSTSSTPHHPPSILFPPPALFFTMRAQLLRSAARSRRVPRVNCSRTFATTVPRAAEVELTIGKWTQVLTTRGFFF